MATAATDTPTGVPTDICGYCLERGDNPRVLPCSHVFCTPCLKKYLKETKVLKCGKCRTAYDKTIEDLPSVNTTKIVCQSCERKGVSEPAVVYCKECDKKFCSKHEESHNDVLEHNVISIDMYLMEADKLQPRYCRIHSNSILSLACQVCSKLLCIQCFDGEEGCTTKDSKHQPVSLSSLAGRVRVKVGKLKAEAQEKEGELAGLMKQSTRTAEDIDKETEQLRELLHKTRDEQIGAIRKKYDALETQLLDLRQKSRAVVAEFIEKDVGARLDSLSAEIQRLDAYVRDSHEVDLIDKFSHFEKLMKELMDVRNPSLVIKYLSSLELKGECRDTELKIVQSMDSTVLSQSGSEVSQSVTIANAPPTYITPIIKAMLPYSGSKIHVMNGTAYTFSYGGKMSSVGVDGMVTHFPDVTATTAINAVTGYNGEVFILNFGNPWKIVVVDTQGNFLRKWNRDDGSGNTNQLTAVGGKIVVPNFFKQQLTVYSVTGEIIKNIPCQINDSTARICSCGTGSVIITSHGQTSVSRVNITSGRVVWSCSAIGHPRHVACWRNSYVLVVDADKEISVLDAETGKSIKRLPVKLQDYDDGDVSVEKDRLAAVVDGGIRLYKIE